MRNFVIAVICILSALELRAQSAVQLDSSFLKARQELDAIRQEFADSADAALADYLKYEAQLFAEYEAFQKEVMQQWGDSVAVESTRKEWVEYSDDRTSRTVVNWESGDVAVEILVDPSDDEETIRQKLEAAVAGLLSSRGSTNSFDSKILPSRPVAPKPVLDGMLDLTKYGISATQQVSSSAPKPFGDRKSSAPAPTRGGTLNVSKDNSNSRVAARPRGTTAAQKAIERRDAEEQARLKAEAEAAEAASEMNAVQPTVVNVPAAIVAAVVPQVHEVKTDEGKKNVVTITMELVEDHIPKRAEQFKGMISKHTDAYSMDAPLIYAIMEQESAFNPMAQSWVPAYGLMQLVPKSGGRDAYRYVHKEDRIPSPEFLFDPENNIQLGTGYLKLLMSTTFAKVTDHRCRMLCAIAAYNTGAGNVSRAINGTTNISKAIPTINTMSYDELYAYLREHLPHAETKDYIMKVTSKMEKYMK